MRSGMAALAVAAGTSGLVALVSLVGAPESVVEEHPEVREPVVRTTLVCPYVGGEEEGWAHLAMYAVPGVPTVDEPDTPVEARELAVVPEPGETPEPEATELPEPVLTLDERGPLERTSMTTEEPASVAIYGEGIMASGLAAEQSLLVREVDLHGLSTTSCSPAEREHWFVGASGEVGKRGRLILSNPTSVAAVVDVELWDEAGPIDAPATTGISVPARSRQVLLIDALAPESERVGVHVSTTQGRVSAALEVRETDEITPQGMSFIPPAVEPQDRVVIPGVPGEGERTLRIVAPGRTDAIVSLRMFGPSGPFTPVDAEVITVPSGTVHEVPLEGQEDPVAIELESDQPVTASVRVVDEPDEGLRDVAFTAATPPLDGPAAVLLGRADAYTSTLYVSSVGEGASRVVVQTLDDDGEVADEQDVDVPAGATVPVELEPPDEDAAFVTAVIDPGQSDAVALAREIRASRDDGQYVDLLPVWSPVTEVGVPRVVGELPGVLDHSEED